MRTTLFFFAMLACVTASTTVTVTPISADYATQEVTFKMSWTNTPQAVFYYRQHDKFRYNYYRYFKSASGGLCSAPQTLNFKPFYLLSLNLFLYL
jgi:hypothetical protein